MANQYSVLSFEERFWERVNKNGPEHPEFGQCWIWTGYIHNRNGFGFIKEKGVPCLAHRSSYELHFGAIPKSRVVNQSCENKICVRPEHLVLGTYKEKIHKMIDKGMSNFLGNRKLSDEDIVTIRHFFNDTTSHDFLSRHFKVSICTIKRIQYGYCWKKV